MANPTLPPSQTLTANEKLVDLYMERAIDLLRLEAGTRDKVLLLLHDLEKQLVTAIAAADPNGLQHHRLASLLQQVNASIQATYRTTDVLMGQEIREIADNEAVWTGRAIDTATHANFATTGLTRGFLDTLVSDILIQGAPSSDWWSRQAQGLSNRFADQVRIGMAAGETNADLVKRIRGTKTQPGLMQVSRISAERLVRASVQTTANAARNKMYAENSDLISAVQWHATLDTRTSIWCITRDGHKYDPHDHQPKDGGPPWLAGPGALHWGCRSTSIPVLKSWKELGIDEAEVSRTTRASMDGQVPHELSFEAWLKKQTVARQDTVLGDGKAALWRAGKISFRDLLDQSGRPLSTEELRKKYA